MYLESPESTQKVIDWAKNKKYYLIASGYNKSCSSVDPEIFDQLRKHTNAVESTHYKSNSMGRYLSLLRAVK